MREQFSILVVDDNESARYAMARGLRAAGYKTMEACSGAQALEFAEYVSAVILDVHLPDLLGWEVCRLLRSRQSTSNVPVIHVSARHASGADTAQSRDCGADAFFSSPVDPEALVALLDRLLAARAG